MLLDLPTRLETERLVLRAYQPGDGAAYHAAGERNREHLQRFETHNSILNLRSDEQAEVFIRELAVAWASRVCFMLGGFNRVSGEFICQIYIGAVNWETPEFELGYFVDRDHQGQGFVTEAGRAALGFIFESLQAQRVHVECSANNLRSAAVAERLGFQREALLRANHREPDGTFSDTLVFGLLRSEWEKSHTSPRI